MMFSYEFFAVTDNKNRQDVVEFSDDIFQLFIFSRPLT